MGINYLYKPLTYGDNMKLVHGDCIEALKDIPDKSVDLVVMDPPYELETHGCGAFGNANREYHAELNPISKGITNKTLDLICSKMKKINIYIWCNKAQLRQYIDYFDDRKCNMDLLTWHKTNPTPTCGNKYLSDTEYLLFFREKGVKVYGSYDTKRKFYVTAKNKEDRDKYHHPTVKPIDIIRNLIINSSQPGDLVMDPFMGSGTTGAACADLDRDFIGIEINEDYFDTAKARIKGHELCRNTRDCEDSS